MSNQHWPPPSGNGAGPTPPQQSPWSQPDARFSPQSFNDVAGRDPRAPFGQAAAPGRVPDLVQFEAPRQSNRKVLLLGLAIVAAIVALVLVLQFTGGFTPTTPASSPSPTNVVASDEVPEPAATGGTSIPFEGNGTGVFEILKQEWNDEGLTIDYRITLDEGQGERSFSLYMFTDATLEVLDPIDIELATVTPESPFTGTVRFAAEQAKGTLVLSSFNRALQALPIKG